MGTEKIPIKDLPEDILRASWQSILPYSIGLLQVVSGEGGERAQLMGSGTLVRVDDKQGILTAQHVVASRRWKQSTHLGLCFLADIHRPIIHTDYLKVLEVARPLSDSKGPDLAVILLPPTDVTWLQEKRLFWNISVNRKHILPSPLDKDIGVWFVCGFPDEFTKREEPQRGFDQVMGYFNLSGYSGVEREWADANYDFVDLPVLYEQKSGLPISFGGISGGGVWQVPLLKTKEGEIQAKEPIFSGVAFYQTKIVDKKRTIRCHGRRSVYEIVYKALKQIV